MVYLYYYTICINNGTNICAVFHLDIMVPLCYYIIVRRSKATLIIRLVGGRKEIMEDSNMIAEFKAVLIAILDFLEHGETDRAITYIREVLSK